MINPGVLYHQPVRLKWYYLFNILAFCLLAPLPLAGIVHLQSGEPFFQTWSLLAFGLFGTLGVIIYLFLYLEYYFFRFMIGSEGLVINSGIIVKSSKTIIPDSIQTVDYVRDPIMWLFGIQRVQVWTASPQQVEVAGGKTKNQSAASFFVAQGDFEDLKKQLLYKVK